jgi:hypothetical protein
MDEVFLQHLHQFGVVIMLKFVKLFRRGIVYGVFRVGFYALEWLLPKWVDENRLKLVLHESKRISMNEKL